MPRRGGKQSRFSKSIKNGFNRLRGGLKRKCRAARAALGLKVGSKSKCRPLKIMDLPLEIREQIWRHAVGDMHVGVSHKRFFGSGNLQLNPVTVLPIWESHMPVYKGHWEFVNLLLTCRQIYDEAVRVVYSTNLFEFQTATAMFCMESRTRDKWNMIRKIALCWDSIAEREDAPIDPFYWVSACGVVGYMDNLVVAYFVVDKTRTLATDYFMVAGELSLLALRPIVIKTVILHPQEEYVLEPNIESTVNPEFYNQMRDLGIPWTHARYRRDPNYEFIFGFFMFY